MKLSIILTLFFLLNGLFPALALVHRYQFVLQDTSYTRLCNNKTILTVNGKFPGPTLYVTEGDTLVVDVINQARENVTIHWHGVKQVRNPWSDGPAYITQCPIRPGTQFRQRIVLSDEIGTLWWHAHSDWSRATVHGALVVRPRRGNVYPFPKPATEVPIILAEWWNIDITRVLSNMLHSGLGPVASDAFLINGQPGDLYNCSSPDTFKLTVDRGRTYLIRMVNAVMNNIMYFRISNHTFTIVGSDGAYLKPFQTDLIAISPGQTIDFLLQANQQPGRYYMASRVHSTAGDPSTSITTAIVEYRANYSSPPSTPSLPTLPEINDTLSFINFIGRFRSLASRQYPMNVPQTVDEKLLVTASVNIINGGTRNATFRASFNNITFVPPSTSILQAYYNRIGGVYGNNFPSNPPLAFNYSQDIRDYYIPQSGTEVRVLGYNTTVELVYQGTGLLGGISHPIHLHGYNFYVVGRGLGNFDNNTDPANYNLVDPPYVNNVAVPKNGWTAIRFQANNPGVWFMHCQLERHATWGMEMAFIVRNGNTTDSRILPPPRDFPTC